MSQPGFPTDDPRLDRLQDEQASRDAQNEYFAKRYYLQGWVMLTAGSVIGFLLSWASIGIWWGVGTAILMITCGLALILAAKKSLPSGQDIRNRFKP